METLRELTEEMYQLMELADSNDPEDQQAFQDTLDGLVGMIEQKADQYCTALDMIKGNIAAHDMEIQRLQERKRVMENNVKRMKDALLAAMVAMDEKRLKTELYSITRCTNGGKQPMKIDGDVPDNYKRIVYENDTDKIRADLEQGIELPFAHLEARGEHIMIK